MQTHRLRGIGRLSGALAATTLLGTANAREPTEWYAGLSHANTHIEVYRGLGWEQAQPHHGLAMRGGARLTQHLALELGVLRASNLEWREYYALIPGLPHNYDTTATFNATSQQLSVVGILPFGRIWEGFLRGGIVRYHVSGHQTLTDAWTNTSLAPRPIDRHDSNGSLALGIGARIQQNWQLRVEVQTIGLATDFLTVPGGDTPTLDAFAVGVDYRFRHRER
jgi:hypothetical protein